MKYGIEMIDVGIGVVRIRIPFMILKPKEID